MTKEQINAIEAMTKTQGRSVLSGVLQETLSFVERAILNGTFPEGERMSYIARRWFLLYILCLPKNLAKDLKPLLGESMSGSPDSNKALVEKYNLL